MVHSFQDVIDRLGGATAFARSVGMEPNTARQARKRNSLAPQWFAPIVELARAKGVDEITLERLVELATERRKAA